MVVITRSRLHFPIPIHLEHLGKNKESFVYLAVGVKEFYDRRVMRVLDENIFFREERIRSKWTSLEKDPHIATDRTKSIWEGCHLDLKVYFLFHATFFQIKWEFSDKSH